MGRYPSRVLASNVIFQKLLIPTFFPRDPGWTVNITTPFVAYPMLVLDPDHLSTNPSMVIAIIICVALVFVVLYRSYARRGTATKFRGPPSTSFLFGVTKDLFGSPDLNVIYGNWEKTYGPVYEIPSGLGSTILVLQDPKAITDFFSKDTTTYHQFKFVKVLFKSIMMVRFSMHFILEAILIRPLDRPVMYCWSRKGRLIKGPLILPWYLIVLLMFIDMPDSGGLYQMPSRTLPLRISDRKSVV